MKLTTPWPPFLASLLIALLGALAACGGDETTPEASATIGPAGGTLNGPDGVQLVVPPGALASANTLRLGSNPRLRNARGVWAVSSTELLINANQALIRVRLP